MNVLHTDFHRGWGGQAGRVLMLCEELRRRGHGVIVAAPPGELSRRARQAGLRVEDRFSFRPPARLVSFTSDVRRLAGLIREERIDVLHTHGSQDTWAGAAARALTGAPSLFVATRHNTKPVRFSAANRYLYGRALDHVILASESVRERFAPFVSAGVMPAKKMTAVHSAYRTGMFHEAVEPGRLRAELGLQDRGPILGVLARLVTDKGHTFLFEAMGEIVKAHPRAVLLLAGRGPHEEALRAEVASRGIADSVRFLGFRDDAAELTALLDVAVLPSIGCDASSASIKEAMVMGRPIVATDVGGAREIIDDGVTGFVVPPASGAALASSILKLLADPDKAKEMGERGRDEVRRRYSPAALADGVLAVYESAVAEARRAGARVSAPAAGHGGGRA